jgi:hypothetical protein
VKWAYSLVVKRAHGMRDIGVRFPVGPQRIADLLDYFFYRRTPFAENVKIQYLKNSHGIYHQNHHKPYFIFFSGRVP